MTQRPLSIAAALLFLALAGALLWTRLPNASLPLSDFGALPVWMGGRSLPLDAVARLEAGKIGGPRLFSSQPPIEWLAAVLLDKESADKQALFPVRNRLLKRLLANGQPPETEPASGFWARLSEGLLALRPNRYSRNEIQPHLDAIEALALEGQSLGPASRSSAQSAAARLVERYERYEALGRSLRLFEGPGQTERLRALAAFAPQGMRAVKAQRAERPFDKDAYHRMIEIGFRMQSLKQSARFWPLPPKEGGAWKPLAAVFEALVQTNEPPPAAAAYAALADAYRAGQKPAFEAALERLRERLGNAVPKDLSRSHFESLLNRSSLYLLAALGYALALLSRFAAWNRNPKGDFEATAWLLGAAFALHSLGLLLRLYLHGEPAGANLTSAFGFVGWCGALLGIALERLLRRPWFRSPACLLALLCLLGARFADSQMDSLLPLDLSRSGSFLFAVHSLGIAAAYAAALYAGLAGGGFLLEGLLSARFPPEKVQPCRKAALAAIALAALGSSFAAVAGAGWSDQTRGAFWSWRPAETGALALALWCAAVINASRSDLADARRLMQLSALGGAVAVWSWLDVAADPQAARSAGFGLLPDAAVHAFIALQIVLALAGSLPARLWKSPQAIEQREPPEAAPLPAPEPPPPA